MLVVAVFAGPIGDQSAVDSVRRILGPETQARVGSDQTSVELPFRISITDGLLKHIEE